MKIQKNDRALRFYREVLDLERLHYGIWEPDEELTVANLKSAQKRYEDFLLEKIPSGTQTILDVGCGTGVMLSELRQAGYAAEGLTPDINQQAVLQQKALTPFHACRFEDFRPDKSFDCLIMSESSQYIALGGLFSGAAAALKDGGHLMVCDYFVRNHTRGILAKSGHNFDAFMEASCAHGFSVVDEQEITSEVLNTLRLAKYVVEKAMIALDIGTEKFRIRHPFLVRLFLKIFNKKYNRLVDEMQLIDAEKFQKNKRYHFLLLKAGEDKGD